ncbi:unnamed protein product, partial [Closterium sp. Naga37s-1]
DISNNEFAGPLPSGFASSSLASLPLATFNVERNFFTGSARAEISAGKLSFCPEDQQGGFAAANLLPYSPSQYGSVRGNCLNPRGGGGCEGEGRQRKKGECLAFCGVGSVEGVCGGHGRCFLKGPSRVPVCECEEGYYEDAVEMKGGGYPTCSATKPENPPPPFPPDIPSDAARKAVPATTPYHFNHFVPSPHLSYSLLSDDPQKQRHRPGLRDRDFKAVPATTPCRFNPHFRHVNLGFNGTAVQPGGLFSRLDSALFPSPHLSFPSFISDDSLKGRHRLGLRDRDFNAVPATTPSPHIAFPLHADDPQKQRHRPGLRDRDFKAVPATTPSRFNRFFRHMSLGFNGTAAQPSWAYREAVDWRGLVLVRGRNVTVVPPVKDQGLCAACWARVLVAAIEAVYAIASACWALVPVAAIEAVYAIAYGANHPNLSSQQVLSCQGTWQCTGGIPADVFQFVAAVGGVSAEKAVPYTGVVNASDCKLLPTSSKQQRKKAAAQAVKPAPAAKRNSRQSKPQPAAIRPTTEPPTKALSGPLTGPASRPLKHQRQKATVHAVKVATSASRPAAGPPARPAKSRARGVQSPSKPAVAGRGRQAMVQAAAERVVPTSASMSAGKTPAASTSVTKNEDDNDKRTHPSPSFSSLFSQLFRRLRRPIQSPKLPPTTPVPPSSSPPPVPAFPPQVPGIHPLSGRFSISMFEQVSVPGWLGMVLALQAQPIIANVEADQLSFINYQGGFIYADLDCFANGVVNHIVLLVGYSMAGVTPYFILQNTWGSTWGEGGFMQMAIEAGNGICGINTTPALYPVVAGSHPCQPINPCGSGKCSNRAGKSKFHVCSMSAANPCQVGTCLNDGAGGYNCLCSPGFVADERPDETPVCVPVHRILINTCFPFFRCRLIHCATFSRPLKGHPSSSPTSCSVSDSLPPLCLPLSLRFQPVPKLCRPITFSLSSPSHSVPGVTPSEVHVVPGLTCDSVRSTFGMSEANFTQLNPKLNCSSLAIGDDIYASDGTLCATPYTAPVSVVLCLFAPLFPPSQSPTRVQKLNCSSLAIGDDIYVSDGTLCATPYTVTTDDTCESIAAAFSMTRSEFLRLNDDLPCGRLKAGQQVGGMRAVRAWVLKACVIACLLKACVGAWVLKAFVNGCSRHVCVAHGTPDMPACQEFVTVAEGDSCDTIMRAARPPLSAQEFYTLNPGINCNAGEQMLLGQQVWHLLVHSGCHSLL